MYRIGVLLAGLALCLLLVGEGVSGDKQDPLPKGKTKLPQYWTKLGLSQDQLKMIGGIRATYGPKIADLTKQLDNLKKQEKDDLVKVLTAVQRDQLQRIYAEKAGVGAPKDAPKDNSKDKKDG